MSGNNCPWTCNLGLGRKKLKGTLRRGGPLSYKTAVEYVFDVERIQNAKRKRANVWNLPYLIAYESLTKDADEKQLLDQAMIEYVHSAVDYTHIFSKNTQRYYLTF